MAMITYPLNDVEYTAEDAELYNSTRSSGVYSGEDFSYTVSGTNNNITIGEGIGWIKNSRFSGKVFANKAPVTLALDIADAANPRIDVVAVRFDAAANATDLVIKKGTAAASPAMPEIVQTESVYELYLFSVYRETAATVITADNVTDLRLDASVCGLMADAVTSVDTSAINAQFTALLAKIKQELADLKHDKIDAYTKEETLSPSTKTALGLSEDAVPDDAFASLGWHTWRRRTEESGYTVQETAFSPYNLTAYNIYVFDTFDVNEQTGEVTISKTSVFMEAYTQLSNYASAVRGKYFITHASYSKGDTIYHISENAQFQNYAGEYTIISELAQITVVEVTNVGEYEYVTSPNRHAYPDSGREGVFTYEYLGSPLDNARDAYGLRLHWWKRRTKESGYTEETLYEDTADIGGTGVTFYYGDAYVYSNGKYTITNANSIYCEPDSVAATESALKDKYFATAITTDTLYFAGKNSGGNFDVKKTTVAGYTNVGVKYITLVKYQQTYYENVGEYEYLSSPNRNAYPDSGTEGIFSYSYLAVPFENARDAKKCAIVSYAGTGTYGANSPCAITADFPIKHFWCVGRGSAKALVVNPDVYREQIKSGSYYMWFNVDEKLTETYQKAYGFEGRYTTDYMKRSADGKTISWYSESAAYQLNESNKNYYFLVLG